jgi:uncharacterized membrane protein YgdD (TMEM256/DUF423 family)
MARLFLSLGAVSGLLAVALGAFGAHALRARLDERALAVFETGVQYQFYHAFALLAVGMLALQQPPSPLLRSSGWLFTVGMALSGIRWLGAVTPLGGLAFIAGWGCLLAAVYRFLP